MPHLNHHVQTQSHRGRAPVQVATDAHVHGRQERMANVCDICHELAGDARTCFHFVEYNRHVAVEHLQIQQLDLGHADDQGTGLGQ